MRSSSCLAVAMAVLALLLIGSSASTSVPLHDYPVYGGQALRFGAAALVLWLAARLLALPARRPVGRQWLWFAGLAVFGIAGFNVCLVQATRYGDPSVVGTVIAATPLALAVLGAFQDGRRPRGQVVIGGAVVALGTAVTTGFGATTGTGLSYAFGALACEVAFSLCAVPLLPTLGAVRTSAFAAAGSVPVLLTAGVLADGTGLLRLPTTPELLALTHKALAVAVLANLLWYAALPRIRADKAGLFYGFVPLGTLAMSAALGQESPGRTTVTGIALVLLGLAVGLASFGRRGPRPETRAPAEPAVPPGTRNSTLPDHA
ncbi:DMT family transporter [Streptomyces sp. NPDC058665]|uniref:DMT family transporter n=1 Tax=Streptomyces sp. NPDC058665 TaxID=3346586 RepID=UPI003656ECBA